MSEQIVTPDTAALTVPNKDAKINLLDLNPSADRASFSKTWARSLSAPIR